MGARTSGAGSLPRLTLRARSPALALPFDEQLVLADEQIEVRSFFVSELEEDALAFRVLEAFAVALEKLV